MMRWCCCATFASSRIASTTGNWASGVKSDDPFSRARSYLPPGPVQGGEPAIVGKSHPDGHFKLNLSDANKKDLAEYLKGI
jgi:hypothetical protein